MINFIGFEVSKGTFTPDGGGAGINYDNRNLFMITNEGLKSSQSGFIHMTVKIKTEVLCASFGCTPAEVDAYLNSVLSREVNISYGIVAGKPAVTGFTVVGDKK